jgi:hypothetical protein
MFQDKNKQQGVAEGSEPAPSQMYKMGWNDGVEDEINDQLRQDPEYVRGFRDGLNHAMGPRGRGRSNPRRYGSESGMAEGKVTEKAVSKAQQKFMGMVHAAQKGEKPASKEVAKVAKDMPKKAAKDFAQTKHKGLPEKKKD